MITSPSPPRVICVGACTVDTILKVERITGIDAKILASDCVQLGAGMASSAAAAIARLGGRSTIWGRIGDDAAGEFYLRDLRAEGVDVGSVRIVAGGCTAVSSIIVDGAGHRLVVPFYDPDLDHDPGWLPLMDVQECAAVLVDTRWPEGSRATLNAARAAGVVSVLDADVAAPEILTELAPLADHAVFSEPGLRLFTGDERPIEAALRAADVALPGIVGVSLGADGYRWMEQGEIHAVTPPPVQVVDTLSAGDVFHGAYALALAEGRELADIAEFACRAASLKCTRFGGRAGAPTREEVEAVSIG